MLIFEIMQGIITNLFEESTYKSLVPSILPPTSLVQLLDDRINMLVKMICPLSI